jgi:hypothetical protein
MGKAPLPGSNTLMCRDFLRVCRGPKFGPIPNAKKEMFFPK